jgi:glycosyltransferase involved in cell wall biosynthesis
MARTTEISIVIPVFNEAENLPEVIRKILALEMAHAEIIVVDDGSTDGSAEIGLRAGANVIRHPYNIGNGAAIKTGIRAARGKVLVFMDGDGQHKPEDIPKLLEKARSYHMVVGARSRGSKLRLHRNLANIVYNLLASYVTRFPVKDLTSGFRVLARLDALRFIDLRFDDRVRSHPNALPQRPEQDQPHYRRHPFFADHHQNCHIILPIPRLSPGEFFLFRNGLGQLSAHLPDRGPIYEHVGFYVDDGDHYFHARIGFRTDRCFEDGTAARHTEDVDGPARRVRTPPINPPESDFNKKR